MNYSQYNGFYYVTSELLKKYNIKHLFSTIKDTQLNPENGVSYSVRDGFTDEEIMLNYKKIAEFFNVPVKNITKSTQIHGDNIIEITDYHIGMGVTRKTEITDADGLSTRLKNIPLCIFSADCVPVLLADKKNTVVMAVHSGWRGTGKKILKKAVEILNKKYNVISEDIICAIGPAISQCCFEVSDEVIEAISGIENSEKCYYKKDNGRYQLDLKRVNENLLISTGIPKENIDVIDICTKCEEEYFYSYRRQKEKAGRNAAFIMI